MLYKLILKNCSVFFAQMSADTKNNIVKYHDGRADYAKLGNVSITTLGNDTIKYNQVSSVEEVENPIDYMLFELKPEHIKALKRLNIKSFIENVDSVNIYLDEKRPFRNSDVFGDVFELLGITSENKRNEADEKAMLFLAELPIAYKVIMYHMTFEPGWYRLPDTYEYSNVVLDYLRVKNFVALRKSIKSIQKREIFLPTDFQKEINVLTDELFKIEFGGNKAFKRAMKIVQYQYKYKSYWIYSYAKILKIFNDDAPDDQKISISKDMIKNALSKNCIEILHNCGSKKVSLKINTKFIEFPNYNWEDVFLQSQIDKDKLSDIVYKNVCELLEKDPVSYYRMYLLIN